MLFFQTSSEYVTFQANSKRKKKRLYCTCCRTRRKKKMRGKEKGGAAVPLSTSHLYTVVTALLVRSL